MSKTKSFGDHFPSSTSVPIRNVFSARNGKPGNSGNIPRVLYFSNTTRAEVGGCWLWFTARLFQDTCPHNSLALYVMVARWLPPRQPSCLCSRQQEKTKPFRTPDPTPHLTWQTCSVLFSQNWIRSDLS